MGEQSHSPFGVAAEFATEWQLVEAVTQIRARGYQRLDAYTPFPIPAISTALGFRSQTLRAAGIVCAAIGLVAYFCAALYGTMSDYPFLIAGRPAFSWPYYVIPSVSIGMLAGALFISFGMLFLNRLPRLNHPVFNIKGFERATRDRFFLVVEAEDEHFDPEAVESVLHGFVPGPLSIQRVPR